LVCFVADSSYRLKLQLLFLVPLCTGCTASRRPVQAVQTGTTHHPAYLLLKIIIMLNETNNNPQANGTGITKEQFLAHADELANQLMASIKFDPPSEEKGMFLLRTATRWMEEASNEPEAQMLFGEFWHEGELCILFADTNLGKSILAVQIGDSISRGERIHPLRLQADAQQVVYLDFELTKKQFQNRYQNVVFEPYEWSPLFLRAEIDPENIETDGLTFEEFLNYSLEKAVAESNTKILIIDNLTYLRNETEKAKDALPLMKHLKQMKNKYNLSILALAHTPKRDPSRPINRNDLQGSKMLMNFCDSAFSIGESQIDNNLRYLKQIKQRNTEEIYGDDNVCLFQITKPDKFLKFDFVDYSREWEHLREPTVEDRDLLKAQVADLRTEGKTVREVAEFLGISKAKVQRILETFK
jgi:RecA-family ATPase